MAQKGEKKEDTAETLTVAGREVRVTNPDKPYFTREAKLSKLDVVRYYLSVADGALGGIRDRPIVLKRFVDGAEGEAFYQKRAPDKRPDWLRTVTLSFPSGRTAEEVVVDDAAGLAFVVNLGCIELHPHAVRAGDLDHPDELRVDLDPGPGVGWDDVRRVALEVKALLEELGLTRVAEDQRLARDARQRAPCPALELRRRPPRGAGAVARDRAARADDRHLEVVEGGAPRRLPRLQPERQGPDHLLGLFDPPAPRRARLGAARLERGRRLQPGRLHRGHDAGALRRAPRSPRRHGRRGRKPREAAGAGGARRRRGARRRPLAAPLSQDGG